jgi:RNA-binding protein 25
MQPNRLGLGLRPPLPSYGQGPSISALAQQQQMHVQGFVPPQAQKQISLFVGSISGGITDGFLNDLLSVSVPPTTALIAGLGERDRLAEMSSLSSG